MCGLATVWYVVLLVLKYQIIICLNFIILDINHNSLRHHSLQFSTIQFLDYQNPIVVYLLLIVEIKLLPELLQLLFYCFVPQTNLNLLVIFEYIDNPNLICQIPLRYQIISKYQIPSPILQWPHNLSFFTEYCRVSYYDSLIICEFGILSPNFLFLCLLTLFCLSLVSRIALMIIGSPTLLGCLLLN